MWNILKHTNPIEVKHKELLMHTLLINPHCKNESIRYFFLNLSVKKYLNNMREMKKKKES